MHTEICGAPVCSVRCGTNVFKLNASLYVSESLQRKLPGCKCYDLIVRDSICHTKSPRPFFFFEQINTRCNVRIIATYLL